MCGIAGSFGKISIMQRRILALMNQNRGSDSIGMMSDFRVCRIPTSASEAIKHDRIPDWAWQGDIWAVHTRASSPNMGGISKETTHPFTFGKWTVAHNGFIRNWKEVIDAHKEKHSTCASFKVDSMVIPLVLEVHGFDGLKLLSGSAATWMFNREEKDVVYLWVNDQDLALYESKESIVWSSDNDHLKIAGFPRKGTIRLKDNGQLVKITKELTSEAVGYFPGEKWSPPAVVTGYNYQKNHGYGELNFPDSEGDYWDQLAKKREEEKKAIIVTPVKVANNIVSYVGKFKTVRLCDIPDEHFKTALQRMREYNYQYLWVCQKCGELLIDFCFEESRFIGLTAMHCPVCNQRGEKEMDKDIINHLFAYEINKRIKDNKVTADGDVVPKRSNILNVDGVLLDLSIPEERFQALMTYIDKKEKKSMIWCPNCVDFKLPNEFKSGELEITEGGFCMCPQCDRSCNVIPTQETETLEIMLGIWGQIYIEEKTYIECKECHGQGITYDENDNCKEKPCAICHGIGSIIGDEKE